MGLGLGTGGASGRGVGVGGNGLGTTVDTALASGGGAATGAGVVREGSAYNCIGTSAWIGTASREPVYDPEMRTFTLAHLLPGQYCQMLLQLA